MSSATLYRASGLALLLGALLTLIGVVLSIILFPVNANPTQYTSALYVLVSVVVFLGLVLLVLGLPGMCARQATRAGWPGLYGFVLTIVGGIMLTSLSAINFLILPWLAVNAPQLIGSHWTAAVSGYLLLAGILFAVGGVYLGIVTMRVEVLPRWAGLLIAVGAVLNLVGSLQPGVTVGIVSALSLVLFALGLGWIGYALWTAKGETLQQTVLTP